MPPDVFVLVPLAGMATGAMFMFGIYKLLSRWMDHRDRRQGAGPSAEDLRELRQELEELRMLPDRIFELEERLDFAERLLAQARRERGALGPGEA